MLGLSDDTWLSYCLDNAIWMIGTSIQNELDEVDEKSEKKAAQKRSQILRRWIPEAQQERKFKDPGAAKK